MDSMLYKNKEGKVLKDNLFSDEAEEEVKKWKNENEKYISFSQVRKFYDELLKYNDIVARNESLFEEYKPLIKMIIAKVAYAYAKDKKGFSKNFYNFVKELIGEIETVEDLKNATLFFESSVAFFKLYAKA